VKSIEPFFLLLFVFIQFQAMNGFIICSLFTMVAGKCFTSFISGNYNIFTGIFANIDNIKIISGVVQEKHTV
jgi:hypothetical protein